jgi:hypothetical protein
MTALLLGSMSALSTACSSDDRPEVSAGGGATPPPGGGGTSGDGGSPDGQNGGPTSLCDPAAVSADGEPVGEIIVRADTPPAPLGGEIAPGTYVHTELTHSAPGSNNQDDEDGGGSGAPSSDVLASKALVIDGKTYRFAERTGTTQSGVPETATLSGGTFAIEGTSVVLTETCPGSKKRTIGFSFVGRSLSLYPTSDRRETYQKL